MGTIISLERCTFLKKKEKSEHCVGFDGFLIIC